MEHFKSQTCNDNSDHIHLYGQACHKARFLLCKIRRRTIIRSLLLAAAVLLAFSAGVAFQMGFMDRTSYDSFQFRRSHHFTQASLQPPSSSEHFLPFSPPENTSYRRSDSLNTFSNYLFSTHPQCSISSLHLHRPFAPLCHSLPSFLTAFSGGGRIGFNAPFMPRDCDMRWFTTEEICEVLGRFERVVVVGDSMMRHVVGALNVLLRRDLGYGAVTGWNFGEDEMRDCFCNHQMDVKSCSVQGIFSTSSVLEHDPASFACSSPDSPVDLTIEMMLKFPLVEEELLRFTNLLSPTKPKRPYAFILGHGLWNDLDLAVTMKWIEGVLKRAGERAPYLGSDPLAREKGRGKMGKGKRGGEGVWPVLFIPPNAAGIKKNDMFIVSQGDKALQVFERGVTEELARWGGTTTDGKPDSNPDTNDETGRESDVTDADGRSSGDASTRPRSDTTRRRRAVNDRRKRIGSGNQQLNFLGGLSRGAQIDVLGTYNMSIQADKYDGVHMDLRGNLVKAMGVVNWLSLIDVERW